MGHRFSNRKSLDQWHQSIGNTGKYHYITVFFPLSYSKDPYHINFSIYWNNSRDSIVDTNITIKEYSTTNVVCSAYDSDNNNNCIFLLFSLGV